MYSYVVYVLCPIAPEFSVKYLVLFNSILSIDTSEVTFKSVCNTLDWEV